MLPPPVLLLLLLGCFGLITFMLSPFHRSVLTASIFVPTTSIYLSTKPGLFSSTFRTPAQGELIEVILTTSSSLDEELLSKICLRSLGS